MSLLGPYVLAALLVGIGLYGVLARRNAVLVLIGVELVLGGALVLLVSTAAAGGEGPPGHGERLVVGGRCHGVPDRILPSAANTASRSAMLQ